MVSWKVKAGVGGVLVAVTAISINSAVRDYRAKKALKAAKILEEEKARAKVRASRRRWFITGAVIATTLYVSSFFGKSSSKPEVK
jgi:hypothetical protein